jgi:hypothetical protein
MQVVVLAKHLQVEAVVVVGRMDYIVVEQQHNVHFCGYRCCCGNCWWGKFMVMAYGGCEGCGCWKFIGLDIPGGSSGQPLQIDKPLEEDEDPLNVEMKLV